VAVTPPARAVDTDVVATSEAGPPVPVAVPSPVAVPGQHTSDPGAARGDSSTAPPNLPASAPASSGSVGTPSGAGSADGDLARGLALPANDLSLSPAAAPPSALLEVLLEISVAPD
jgi:hypothetical protein